MREWLVVADLLAIGLGFDIAGAYILARGLFASETQIALTSAKRVGYSSVLAFRSAQDRVDGYIGLATLVLGFAIQTVGYVVVLAVGGRRAEPGFWRCRGRSRLRGRGALRRFHHRGGNPATAAHADTAEDRQGRRLFGAFSSA